MALAGALEQHPPLESTRAHNGKTGQDLFPPGAETGRHQYHLFRYVRKRTRFGDGLVQTDPAIKRLVLGTNERKPGIGVEMLACRISQPQRQIGKLWEPLGLFGVCNKTSRIDENFALIAARVKHIAARFGCKGHSPFLRQDAEAKKPTEFPVNIDPERRGIGRIVITIADAL